MSILPMCACDTFIIMFLVEVLRFIHDPLYYLFFHYWSWVPLYAPTMVIIWSILDATWIKISNHLPQLSSMGTHWEWTTPPPPHQNHPVTKCRSSANLHQWMIIIGSMFKTVLWLNAQSYKIVLDYFQGIQMECYFCVCLWPWEKASIKKKNSPR